MNNFQKAKEINNLLINNRHLYVANIIKYLFDPKNYNYVCEIGAGDLELAKYLAKWYKEIDAFELYQEKKKINNINIYNYFSNYTNVNKYDLLLSICPYYYGPDISDEVDPEEVTMDLLYDIVNMSIDNKKDLFLVLANTYGADEFKSNIMKNTKYRNIIYETIKLRYELLNNKKESENKVLILKN